MSTYKHTYMHICTYILPNPKKEQGQHVATSVDRRVGEAHPRKG